MKKNTFYSILFVGMLTGCAVIEYSDTYSTENIRKAELNAQEEPYSHDTDHYELHVISDSLILTDPNTGTEVYRESLNSNSILSEAILKDNE